MPILEAIVTEPPTSGELRSRVAEAIGQEGVANRLLQLTLQAEQEVPVPQPFGVTLRFSKTTHPEDGSMQVSGHTAEGGSIIVSCPSDRTAPASASLVTP